MTCSNEWFQGGHSFEQGVLNSRMKVMFSSAGCLASFSPKDIRHPPRQVLPVCPNGLTAFPVYKLSIEVQS